MRTIRAGPDAALERERDVRQRPDRHEHRLGPDVLDEEVDGVLLDRLGGARRQLRPVEAALAVHVRGDVELARRAGGRRPPRPGRPARPTSASTRSALSVVFSSVWLPWTVVTPTRSTSGLASASRSAIASS